MMAEKKLMENEGPILIRVSEAARMLGVTTMTVYKMLNNKRLSCYNIPGCSIKVDRREVDKMIRAAYTPHATNK